MKRGKILVIRGGAIGDFVLTLPVFAALRAQFPQAIIEVLGYSHIAELARLGGWVNDVRSIESRALAAFFAEGGDLDPKLAEYLSEFAIIISYLYDPDGIFRTNVSLVSNAQFIEGPHRPDEKQEVHATDVFLKPLERLAIFDADPVPRLPMPDRPVRAVKTPHLVFHPGSGSDRKNWPEEHWVWLIHRVIEETSVRLTIVGGEAEGSRMQRLSGGLPTDRVTVLFQKPLPEVAVWLAGGDYFVGHDSGVSHLAAAAGIGGMVLWGETREVIWRPRSPKFEVVSHPQGLGRLAPEKVWGKLLLPIQHSGGIQ